MNLIETLMQAGNGSVVEQIGKSLGLDAADAQKAIRGLAPAVSQGLSRNTKKQGGLESLMKAIQSGNHSQYLDRPETLSETNAVQDGNAILGHIFGSKDVSRNVAGKASQETGLDSGILKKMLPMIAAAAMGSIAKKSSSGGGMSQLAGALGGKGGNPLEGFLDADKDGSIADDVLSMAKKFF